MACVLEACVAVVVELVGEVSVEKLVMRVAGDGGVGVV